mmetsp:Transcript_59038/g.93387  ORF Transcript_59038/g.93387 Transcript_59038/m.93387 type:complete len:108 (-) Transcript_59038:343-666(-)
MARRPMPLEMAMAILKPQVAETTTATEGALRSPVAEAGDFPRSQANLPMRAGAIPDVEELLNDGDSSTLVDRRPIMLLLAMVALSRPGAEERQQRHERHRKAALGGA